MSSHVFLFRIQYRESANFSLSHSPLKSVSLFPSFFFSLSSSLSLSTQTRSHTYIHYHHHCHFRLQHIRHCHFHPERYSYRICHSSSSSPTVLYFCTYVYILSPLRQLLIRKHPSFTSLLVVHAHLSKILLSVQYSSEHFRISRGFA